MPRWLLLLIVALAVTLTSGVPTVLASITTTDACADECAGDEARTCPDDGGDGSSSCPPFCHGCLCRVHFGTPVPPVAVSTIPDEPELVSVPLLPPRIESPPPLGVFHPPRASA